MRLTDDDDEEDDADADDAIELMVDAVETIPA